MTRAQPEKRDRPAMSFKIGDDAVRAKTGRAWDEWFAALDAAGAARLDHKGIVAILSTEFGLPAWWRQMVAVTYEQARGLRVPHERAGGAYSVSRSKTVSVPVSELFAAWANARARRRWLDTALAVRRATEGKSMRAAWPDGTSLEINFAAKGDAKSQVSVQHDKLADAGAAERLKAYWGEVLDRMKSVLEK